MYFFIASTNWRISKRRKTRHVVQRCEVGPRLALCAPARSLLIRAAFCSRARRELKRGKTVALQETNMVPASELTEGMVIRVEGQIYRVLKVQSKAAAAKLGGMVKAELSNVVTSR